MFYLSMFASVMIGIQSSLGESTTLGFLKGFPGETIGFYGSGTGFAGIFGSGTLIVLKAIKLSDAITYLLFAPTLIPYFFCFWWLDKMKRKYPYIQEVSGASDQEGEPL